MTAVLLSRLSSDLFPWGDSGKYKLEELPELPEIEAVLAEVGTLARLYKQRLTSHPSEFVKMAAQKDDIVWKSLFDLEVHSRVGYKAPIIAFIPCLVLVCKLSLDCFVHAQDLYTVWPVTLLRSAPKISPSVKLAVVCWELRLKDTRRLSCRHSQLIACLHSQLQKHAESLALLISTSFVIGI